MGRRCCIAGCQSTSRLPEHHGVTYHSFPTDNGIRSIWIKNTRLSLERHITKSVLVCSRHFRRNDFQPIRNGKYLLKVGVFPTVFPWGKLDQAQVEADQEALKNATVDVSVVVGGGVSNSEDVTKATVAATVAQILAETAELKASSASSSTAAAAVRPTTPSNADAKNTSSNRGSPTIVVGTPSSGGKYEPATYFGVGARFQAQRNDGQWYIARVLEVSDDSDEVLVRYERNSKNKMTHDLKPEWIAKKKCRQRVNPRGMPVFALGERCLARWSGPHKFPGMIKQLLENDTYEVLFDDGYTKNVRAVHMKKIVNELAPAAGLESIISTGSGLGDDSIASTSPLTVVNSTTPVPGVSAKTSKLTDTSGNNSKKRSASSQRKDWPLLDMANLDLTALNLPEIPRDGEWTCHWVNDQPIGAEGFLIVGEHRKPTVVVEDWRLPEGWVKHMYQRSNVLGKWDVILVSPNGKRFRSKSDLKVFLEDQGLSYNPDIYDFSIHRRRAKDINAYVFTPEYKPQQPPKPKTLEISAMDTTLDDEKLPLSACTSTPLTTGTSSQYMAPPVATPIPPMELMSPQASDQSTGTANASTANNSPFKFEGGYAYIGGLKVQIVDNLFRCPEAGCAKNFRKEDHVLIHVKHYHKDMAKLLSDCPKMQELAVKRTHHSSIEQHESHPKNQIPNQQFFAKLHQQDLQQSRSFRRNATVPTHIPNTSSAGAALSTSTSAIASTSGASTPTVQQITESMDVAPDSPNRVGTPKSSSSVHSQDATTATTSTFVDVITTPVSSGSAAANLLTSAKQSKRPRFSPAKRPLGARKSNRQRTTRRYLTAAQATAAPSLSHSVKKLAGTAEVSLAGSDFEETRQSFNATPDARLSESKKRRVAPTPVSSVESPATGDSSTPNSNDPQEHSSGGPAAKLPTATPQYIKENGELIKIVRMRQEEIINCICGYGEEDGLMIQCELCLCWQHGACNGIVKESDVPDKYVCFICRNPPRGRDSMRFKHDQDWLYEGKLPVANYHMNNPNVGKTFEFLKKSHTLTGNLIETKRFLHSLRVKINIANNRVHPKLYLWAKKWDEDEDMDVDIKPNTSQALFSPLKREKQSESPIMPHVPQPEAAIDPEECQVRLIEHVKVQQDKAWQRLDAIEAEMDTLELGDELPDLKDSDISLTKEALAAYIKELETMRYLAKVNTIANTKETMKAESAAAAQV